MIRIVGIQRNASPEREFVLLQNQGGLRVNLRGHVVMCERAVDEADLTSGTHVFRDDALIPPGVFIVLVTGHGESRWSKTKDGSLVFYAHMNRSTSVWDGIEGPLHILSAHHTYAERGPALLLR